MEYIVQINKFYDKKGSLHTKCTVTIPYEILDNMGLTGKAKKDRTVDVDYDIRSKVITIKKK